jgi:ABC-type lipoprotein export system ATPase subunit
LLQQAAQVFETTIVMVTHEPFAALHADRVVVLRDGAVSGEFAVEKSDDAGQLAARYQAMAR